MNIKSALATAAVVCLSVLAPGEVRAAGGEFAPRKQPLAIPVTVAGAPARALECVVDFGPSTPISALAFSPDGKTLAVGGYREVLIWDLENAKLSQRIGAGGLSGVARALAYLPDGKLLAVGEGTPHGPGAVRLFDVQNGRQTHVFEEPGEVVYALDVSPDGKLLAAGGAEPLVRVWNVADKKLVATLEDHGDWVLDVSFSRDGKLLATAGADWSVRVWDVATWQSSVKLKEGDAARGAAFAADPRSLIVVAGGPDQRTVRLRRTDNLRSIRTIYIGTGMPLGIVWTAKGNRVYIPCDDGTVKVLDGGSYRLLATLGGHQDWVYAAAVNAEGTRIASGSGDGTVKLWNAADNKLLATLVQLAPGSDEWLIITAEGYLAASSSGGLKWKATNLTTPPTELTPLLDKPESVRETLAGKKVAAPALK